MLTEQEIKQRSELWFALSNLWLDTELDNKDYEYIVREMKKTTYSITEIEKILFEEVAPTVYKNTYSVAGEWAEFDKNWLVDSICNHLKQLESNFIYRIWCGSIIARRAFSKVVINDWQKIIDLYKK
jgi:hypothetical protein